MVSFLFERKEHWGRTIFEFARDLSYDTTVSSRHHERYYSNAPEVLLLMTMMVMYSAMTGSAYIIVIGSQICERDCAHQRQDCILASSVHPGWIAGQDDQLFMQTQIDKVEHT